MPDRLDELLEHASRAVFQLNAARKKCRILPATHPYVTVAVNELEDALRPLLDAFPLVTFSFIEGEIHVEGKLMAEESVALSDLSGDLNERGLLSISFSGGITPDELARFVGLSNLRPNDIETRGGWDALLREENITHVSLQRVPALDGTQWGKSGAGSGETGVMVPRELYEAIFGLIVEAFNEVQRADKLDVPAVENMVNMLVAGVMEDENIFRGLSTIKGQHQYTFYHSVNVSILSLLMGARLGLDPATMNKIGTAAILHDVGKMRIPEEILDKPGALTDEEWKRMQGHSLEGARVLSEQANVEPLAIIVALQHHARHDLKGYPKLEGVDRPHFLSELISVADVFNALTSDRAYRKAMLPDKALQIILEGRGTQFDPELVAVFAQLVGLFPVGTFVALDSGEMAVVVRANPNDLCRPTVRLITPEQDNPEDGQLLDLAEKMPDGQYARTIIHSVDHP